MTNVELLPCSEIYSDAEFNSRKNLSNIDVMELAQSIRDNGLLQPIIVQPYTEKEGYTYRIVAGHRRFLACKQINKNEIECIVRPDLSEEDAFTINFAENIQRKDLNILEEALAIEKFIMWGKTYKGIAKKLGVSNGWVQTRAAILKLPDDMRKEVAAGYMTTEHIKQINSYKTRDEQYEFIRKVKDARQRGIKISKPKPKKKEDPLKQSAKSQAAMTAMQDALYDSLKGTPFVRTLAWATGNISTVSWLKDVKQYCEENGRTFVPPTDVVDEENLPSELLE